jgi:proline dehydrogenase
VTGTFRRAASRAAAVLVQRAGRAYVAGDRIEDGLRVAENLRRRGHAATLGYWNAAGEAPEVVAQTDREGARRAAAAGLDVRLSVKSPALQFREDLHREIARETARAGMRIHFDSHAPEAADRTFALAEAALAENPDVGVTLPARWARSPDDARRAAERGFGVRVVKGQWADPSAPAVDASEGFLRVVDALAGRARFVSVASHDDELAARAIERLRRAGTPCEWELLHGLPVRRSLAAAHRLGVATRVYVPYGKGWVPYSLDTARRNPRILVWMLQDLLLAPLRGGGR